MKTSILLIGCTLVAALSPAAMAPAAMAAPFCVTVSGLPDQCLYVDPVQCQREAERQGGRCGANPDEFEAPVSALGYCLAQAGNVVSCVYPAYSDCQTDAKRQGGACIAAKPPASPAPVTQPGIDPFGVSRP
jgi:hypothetical protein